MTTWEPGDKGGEGLSALRVHDAPPERVEGIRARCVAALAARQHRPRSRRTPGVVWREWLEPAFAFGLSALFLAEALSRSLAVYR